MDSTTKNDQEPMQNLECLVKDVDLQAEMEKAKEWAKKNPIPTGESPLRLTAHISSIIFIRCIS